MELEKQVVNLEIAKRMKELGFKQESLFWWKDGQLEFSDGILPECDPAIEIYSAFTLSEMGKFLPMSVDDRNMDFNLRVRRYSDHLLKFKKYWSYAYTRGFIKLFDAIADNEVDARAKLIIELLDRNYYKNPNEMISYGYE